MDRSFAPTFEEWYKRRGGLGRKTILASEESKPGFIRLLEVGDK